VAIIKKRRVDPSRVSSISVDWDDAPTEFSLRRCVSEIYGPSGSGRSTLALSAPGPIAYLFFHEKVQGIVQEFAKTKQIKWKKMGGSFRGSESNILDKASEAMRRFEDFYYDSFSWATTVIVDTHNEAWMLERLGEFGAPKPDGGRVDQNYAAINNRWLSMLNHARDEADANRCNTIFVGQTESEWKEDAKGFGKKTGKIVRIDTSASQKVYLKSDVVIRTEVSINRRREHEFKAIVDKPWWNSAYMDFEIPLGDKPDQLQWPDVMGMITETDAEEWRG